MTTTTSQPVQPESAYGTDDNLPSTLFGLLGTALDDFAVIEKDPKYRVAMNIWHEYDATKDQCIVSLSGAILAVTKSMNRRINIKLGSIYDDGYPIAASLKRKLFAIDDLRIGDVKSAWRTINLGANLDYLPPNLPHDRDIIPYYKDSKEWWNEMNQLRVELEDCKL